MLGHFKKKQIWMRLNQTLLIWSDKLVKATGHSDMMEQN